MEPTTGPPKIASHKWCLALSAARATTRTIPKSVTSLSLMLALYIIEAPSLLSLSHLSHCRLFFSPTSRRVISIPAGQYRSPAAFTKPKNMSALLRSTRPLRFFKNDKKHDFANPARRWYYHWALAGGVVLVAGSVIGSYQMAKWEAHRHGTESGRFVCTYSLREVLSLAPFNRLSNLVGQLVAPGPLPRAVHEKCIDLLVWFYKIDLSDSETTQFESLQDFYVRRWAPGSRPVAGKAVAVCPCDAEVLAIHEAITGSSLVQVKGLTYGIQSLFRSAPGDVPRGSKRVAVVLHLRTKDHHHVVSPLGFTCDQSVYVPGELLPVTAAGYHWLPGVLTTNERLVIQGTTTASPKTPVALAMVGSTLTGRMTLAFDRRVRTNFLDPPDYAVHSTYKPARPLPAGASIGTFYWGSSVVLMLDVPEKAQFQCRVGDSVKAGQALLN